MDVKGARVLVTGASRGIGEGVARRFAAASAHVIAAARTTEAIDSLAADIGGVGVALDVSDPAQVDGLIDRLEKAHGPIDILINNAGVETAGLLEDIDEADIERTIRINLITPQRLTHQIIPKMLERGRGHLVYTSSVAATAGNPTMSVYSASKGGLTRFAESIRIELANDNVGVTVLHLGPVRTSMWDRLEAIEGNRAAIERGQKVGALDVTTVDAVAEATFEAVRKNKREVRLPVKTSPAAFLNGLGTRLTELTYRGIDFRSEHGKR